MCPQWGTCRPWSCECGPALLEADWGGRRGTVINQGGDAGPARDSFLACESLVPADSDEGGESMRKEYRTGACRKLGGGPGRRVKASVVAMSLGSRTVC